MMSERVTGGVDNSPLARERKERAASGANGSTGDSLTVPLQEEVAALKLQLALKESDIEAMSNCVVEGIENSPPARGQIEKQGKGHDNEGSAPECALPKCKELRLCMVGSTRGEGIWL